MKKLNIFLFLFILYLFIPNKVYADTWFDEGNYNPNWREKCSYTICKNFDERDLAGIVSSDLKSEEVPSISEIYFAKKDLDFTGHIWIETPHKLYGKILDVDTITLNYGGFIEKNFSVSNSIKINYIYKVTDIPEGVSVDKTEELRKGDKLRVKVTPKEGYTYELKYAYIDYNLQKNSYGEVTKVGEDTYEIVVSKYNVGFELKYIPIKYNVNFDLDEGVLIPRDDYINYHENKTIHFITFDYYTIISIVVDGEMVDFTDNSITLYGDKDYQVEVKTIKNKPDNIKRSGKFSVQLNINKIDPNNSFLHDCVFQLRDKNNYFQLKSVLFDNTYKISINDDNSPGVAKKVYNADSVSGDYYLLYQMLSSKYQKMIDSVKTAKDLESLKNSKLFIHGDVSFIDLDNNITEHFLFYYPLILDEVKAPLGFKKEKRIVVVPFLVDFVFYLDKGSETLNSNSPLVGVYLSFDNRDTTYVIDYDESLINDNFNDYILKNYENNINSDSKICSRGIKSRKYGGADIIIKNDCEVTIIDQPGTPKLEIINTVNNRNSLTVTKNSKLEYKVTLNNIGTATSTENVIVTEIPKGIEYVVDSASDNGFYDAENNTITWNLDSIGEGDSHEFKFYGIVSDGAVANKNYIQNSHVSSKQLARVNSNETVVKILTNPITFSSLILFMFTVLLVGIILVFGTQLIRDVK